MTGSPLYSIEKSRNFERSFKKLVKAYQRDFPQIIINLLEELMDNPYPANSRDEPLPTKTKLSEGWTFHKLELKIAKGASGQIRLMYLVNEGTTIIKPLWIYSHEQFAKRPADKDIKVAIQEALDPIIDEAKDEDKT